MAQDGVGRVVTCSVHTSHARIAIHASSWIRAIDLERTSVHDTRDSKRFRRGLLARLQLVGSESQLLLRLGQLFVQHLLLGAPILQGVRLRGR